MSIIFTAEMMLVPALMYTYLLFPFRAVNLVHVSKNAAVDNLITTTIKRGLMFRQQKRTEPLFDHIGDSKGSREVHRDVGE